MAKLPTTYPTLVSPDPRFTSIFSEIVKMFQRIAGVNNNPDFGTTLNRPTQQLVTGQTYFDTTIGKPIWWNAVIPHWVDATGANV
jgi:hypothetical protein